MDIDTLSMFQKSRVGDLIEKFKNRDQFTKEQYNVITTIIGLTALSLGTFYWFFFNIHSFEATNTKLVEMGLTGILFFIGISTITFVILFVLLLSRRITMNNSLNKLQSCASKLLVDNEETHYMLRKLARDWLSAHNMIYGFPPFITFGIIFYVIGLIIIVLYIAMAGRAFFSI